MILVIKKLSNCNKKACKCYERNKESLKGIVEEKNVKKIRKKKGYLIDRGSSTHVATRHQVSSRGRETEQLCDSARVFL